MTIRKRNGHYYTDFYIRGKRIQRKIPGGVTNKAIALKYENYLKHQMLTGQMGLSQSDPDLSTLIAKYLEYSRTNKAPSTFERDEMCLRNFITISGLRKFSDITPLEMENYKSERLKSVKKRTVNLEVGTVKAMVRKAVEWGLVADNPISSVSKIRGAESRTLIYLTKDEIDALFKALTPTYFPLVYTYLTTGIRKSELVHLEWDDIDFKNKQIHITSKERHPTKTYKSRIVPMSDKLEELLRSIKRTKSSFVFLTKNGTIRKNNILTNVKRAAKRAGITKNVTLHILRHSFASHMVMEGADIVTVGEILGHSDLRMTRRYVHLSDEHRRKAVKHLPY